MTAMHCGAGLGDVAAVLALVAAHADVAARTTSLSLAGPAGMTPLHTAAPGGHADVVEVLLAAAAAVNARSSFPGFAPLHNASIHGGPAVVAEVNRQEAHPAVPNRLLARPPPPHHHQHHHHQLSPPPATTRPGSSQGLSL
jgi:hypothetical protein